MEAKIEKISELSKLLSVKTRMSDDLFHLFGKFGIGHLLSRLSLEKQDGVSASELLLSLCLFRIVGESIHSICKHKIYELSNHGKNCFYRMMIRPQMDWRRLMNHFALRYMCLLRKYGEVPQSDTTTCFITKVSHPLKHCLFSFTFACRPPYPLTFNTCLTEVMQTVHILHPIFPTLQPL